MAGGPGDARATLQARPPQVVGGVGQRSTITQIQVFGRRDSRDTQKALRFFRERRIAITFVDVATKQLAPAELRRFADRLTPRALLDDKSRVYADSGLAYMRLGNDELYERLLREQRLLRLPLVRHANEVSVGIDEVAWKRWLSAAG